MSVWVRRMCQYTVHNHRVKMRSENTIGNEMGGKDEQGSERYER